MNEATMLPRAKAGSLKLSLTCLAILAFSLTRATAGTEMKEITPPACTSCCMEKDWTLELGAGVSWSNVRSGQPNQAYTIVPDQPHGQLEIG